MVLQMNPAKNINFKAS